jgi:hypothetical protein
MHKLNARAAQEGVKLSDYVVPIAQATLQHQDVAPAMRPRSPVPVFHRTDAKPLPALSGAELAAELDTQDAEKLVRLCGNRKKSGERPN